MLGGTWTASSLSFSSDLVRGGARALSGEAARREKRGRCVSPAFCSTDQEKRETAHSLGGTTKSMMLVLKKAYRPVNW